MASHTARTVHGDLLCNGWCGWRGCAYRERGLYNPATDLDAHGTSTRACEQRRLAAQCMVLVRGWRWPSRERGCTTGERDWTPGQPQHARDEHTTLLPTHGLAERVTGDRRYSSRAQTIRDSHAHANSTPTATLEMTPGRPTPGLARVRSAT